MRVTLTCYEPYRDGTWTRADELDRVAEHHARTHPTRISATPEAT